MERVTNYEYSKRRGKPPQLYKLILTYDNKINGCKVLKKDGVKVKLGDNAEVELLDEYNFYYTLTGGEEGSPVFVVNNSNLYLCCYWGDIYESEDLFKDLAKKVFKKELTAFDLISFLVV